MTSLIFLTSQDTSSHSHRWRSHTPRQTESVIARALSNIDVPDPLKGRTRNASAQEALRIQPETVGTKENRIHIIVIHISETIYTVKAYVGSTDDCTL